MAVNPDHRYGVDPKVTTSLGELLCPDGEECALLLREWGSSTGIVLFLRRSKGVLAESIWIRDYDARDLQFPYIYAALLEKEPPEEIIAAVRRLLEAPEIPAL